MNLSLTKDEASLVRYACQELASRRQEQGIEAKTHDAEWSQSNFDEAKAYRDIASRISKLESNRR